MKKFFKIFGFVVLGITAVIGVALGIFAIAGGFKQEKIEITSLYFEDENGATSDTLYLYGVLEDELVNIKFEPSDATETKLKFTPVGTSNVPMLDLTKLNKADAKTGFTISPIKKENGKNVGGSIKLKVSSANNDNCFCYIYVVVDVEMDENTIDFKAPNLLTQIDTELGYAKSYLAKKASNQKIYVNAPDSNGLNIDTAAIAKGIKKDVYLDYDSEKIQISKTEGDKTITNVVSGSIINKVVSKDAVENSIEYIDLFYDRLNNKYAFTINPTNKTGNTKISMRMHRTYAIQEEYNSKFAIKEEVVEGNYRYTKYISKFEEYRNFKGEDFDNLERTNIDKFNEYTQLVNDYNEFLNKYLKFFTKTENANNFFYTYILDGKLTLDYKEPEEQILRSLDFVFVEEIIYLYVTDVEVGKLEVGNYGTSNWFSVGEKVNYSLSELTTEGIYNDEGSLKYGSFRITIEADNTGETNQNIINENNLAVQSMLSNIEVEVYAYTKTGSDYKVAEGKDNGLVGIDKNRNTETNFTRFINSSEKEHKDVWYFPENKDGINIAEKGMVLDKTFLEVVKNEDNSFTFYPKVPTSYLQDLESDINLYLRFKLRVESAEYGTGYFYDYAFVKVTYKNVNNFTIGSVSNMTINEGDNLTYNGEKRTQLLTSTTITEKDSPYTKVFYFVEADSNTKKDGDEPIYYVNVLKDKKGKAIDFEFKDLAGGDIQSIKDGTNLKGHLICVPDYEEDLKYVFNKVLALNITGTIDASAEKPIRVFAVVLLTDLDGNPITNMGMKINMLSEEASADDKSRELFVVEYPKSINDVKEFKTEYVLDRLYYYTISSNENPYYYEEKVSGVGTVLKSVEYNEYFLRNNRPLEVESQYTILKLLAEDSYEKVLTVSPVALDENGDVTVSIELDEYGNRIDVCNNILVSFTKAYNNKEFDFIFEDSSNEIDFAEVYTKTIEKDLDGNGTTDVVISNYFEYDYLKDAENKPTDIIKNLYLNVKTLEEESGINTINLKEVGYSYTHCSSKMDGAVATTINFINVSNINTIYHNDVADDGTIKDEVILENIYKNITDSNTPTIIAGNTTWQIDQTNTEFFFDYYVSDAFYNIAEYMYNQHRSGGSGIENPGKAEIALRLMDRSIYTNFRGNFTTIFTGFATILEKIIPPTDTENELIKYFNDANMGIDYGSSYYLLKEAVCDFYKISDIHSKEFIKMFSNYSLVNALLRENKDALSFSVSVDLFTQALVDASGNVIKVGFDTDGLIIPIDSDSKPITNVNDIYEIIYAYMLFGKESSFESYKNKVDANKITFYNDLKDDKEKHIDYAENNGVINIYLNSNSNDIVQLINNFYSDKILISRELSEIKNDYETFFEVISALKIILEDTEVNKSGMTVSDLENIFDLNSIKNKYENTEDNKDTDGDEKAEIIVTEFAKVKTDVIRPILLSSLGTPYVTYHNGYAEYFSGLDIETLKVNSSEGITNEGQYQRLKNIVRTLNFMLPKDSEIKEDLNLVKTVLNNWVTEMNFNYTFESGKVLTLTNIITYYTTLSDLISSKRYQASNLTLQEYKDKIKEEKDKAGEDGQDYIDANTVKLTNEYIALLLGTKVDSSFGTNIIENAIKNITSNANSDSLVDIKYIQKNEELEKYFEWITEDGEILVDTDGYIAFRPYISGSEIDADDYVIVNGVFDFEQNGVDSYDESKYSLKHAEFENVNVGDKGHYSKNITYVSEKQLSSLNLVNWIYNCVYFEISTDKYSFEQGTEVKISKAEEGMIYKGYFESGKYIKPMHTWVVESGYSKLVEEVTGNESYYDVSNSFVLNNTNGTYYQITYYVYISEKTKEKETDNIYELNSDKAEYIKDSNGKYFYNRSKSSNVYYAYVQNVEVPVTIKASFYPYFIDGVTHYRSVHEKEFIFKLRFEVKQPVINSTIYVDNKVQVDSDIDSYKSEYNFAEYEYYVENIELFNDIASNYALVKFKSFDNTEVPSQYAKYYYIDGKYEYADSQPAKSQGPYDLYVNGILVAEKIDNLLTKINESTISPNQEVLINISDINLAVIKNEYSHQYTIESDTTGLYNWVKDSEDKDKDDDLEELIFTAEPTNTINEDTNGNGSLDINEDLNGNNKLDTNLKEFYYEIFYNGNSIVGDLNASKIWGRYENIIKANNSFEFIVNKCSDLGESEKTNLTYSDGYNKIKFVLNEKGVGLFDKDEQTKHFKLKNALNGKYDLLVYAKGEYKKLTFVDVVKDSGDTDGYYVQELNGSISYDNTGNGNKKLILGDSVVIKGNIFESLKFIYTRFGNYINVDNEDNYLNAEFAFKTVTNTTTNQFVVYGNTKLELAKLINFKQDENSLLPHMKFKISDVQNGKEVAYFIWTNGKTTEERDTQVGYNSYVSYDQVNKIAIATQDDNSEDITLYFRNTNSIRYINLDMYLLIGNDEVKVYTYYITIKPSITLVGTENYYKDVDSGQFDLDLGISVKQVVNEVGTMVDYGEYAYAIEFDKVPEYLELLDKEEYSDGEYTYYIFKTMNIKPIYNTTESFNVIVCYKNSDGKYIVPHDSSYKITVYVRPTHIISSSTSQSNPYETIYYENLGTSENKPFDLSGLNLFEFFENAANKQPNKTNPVLTYSIEQNQLNDLVQGYVKDGIIKIKENTTTTLEINKPISEDFTLVVTGTYFDNISGSTKQILGYIKFTGLNFYFDIPNNPYGENNGLDTTKENLLGKGALPLNSENGYKLADDVDSTLLKNLPNYEVTLMANNTYDLRTIVNLTYYDKSHETTNPISIGFEHRADNNPKDPSGTQMSYGVDYAGIKHMLTIPRIYDTNNNENYVIVIDIYAYVIKSVTGRVAYDTGRDLIITVVPDYTIALNNNVTSHIATVQTVPIYGLELLNGKSIFDTANLFTITSSIYGTSLYNEEGFDLNKFLNNAVTVSYDLDTMDSADDKYYIVENENTFTEIDKTPEEVVELITGQTITDLNNGIVDITKFAYNSENAEYYNVLVPIIFKNNSLLSENQLIYTDQIYIKVANTETGLTANGNLSLSADNSALVYSENVTSDKINLSNNIELSLVGSGFSNDFIEEYNGSDDKVDYFVNISLADDYNNNFYKSFVEIRSRYIDTNGDGELDYELHDQIIINPSINNSISLQLQIEYVFVDIKDEVKNQYNIIDVVSGVDLITLNITANYEMSIDETKYEEPINQTEETNENSEIITEEISDLKVYSIHNYQNIFTSDLFSYKTTGDSPEEVIDESLKILIATQGIESYQLASDIGDNAYKYYKWDNENKKYVSIYRFNLVGGIDNNGRLEFENYGYDILIPVQFNVYGGFGETKTNQIEIVTVYFKVSSNEIETTVGLISDPEIPTAGLNETYEVNNVEYLAGNGVFSGTKIYDLTKNIYVSGDTDGDGVINEIATVDESEETVTEKIKYFFNFDIISIDNNIVSGNSYKEGLISLEEGVGFEFDSKTYSMYNKLKLNNLTKNYKIVLTYDYYIVKYVVNPDGTETIESVNYIPSNAEVIVYGLQSMQVYTSWETIALYVDDAGEDINGYAILNNQSIFTTPNETTIKDENDNILINGNIIYAVAGDSYKDLGFGNKYPINDSNYLNALNSKVELKYSETASYKKWDSTNNAYINYSNISEAIADIFNDVKIPDIKDGIISIKQLDYDVILPINVYVEGELIKTIYVKVYGCFVADDDGNKVSEITINSNENINLSEYLYNLNGSTTLTDNGRYNVMLNYKAVDSSSVQISETDYNAEFKQELNKYYTFISKEFGLLDNTIVNGFIEDIEYFKGFDIIPEGSDSADGIISDDEFKNAFSQGKFKLIGLTDNNFDSENSLGIDSQLRERVYLSLKDSANFNLLDENVLRRIEKYFQLVLGVTTRSETISEISEIWTDFKNMVYSNNEFDVFIAKYTENYPNLESELLMFAYRNLLIKETANVYVYDKLFATFNLMIDNGNLSLDKYMELTFNSIQSEIDLFKNYIKSKSYLEGNTFVYDTETTNNKTDKFSVWLQNYLSKSSNNATTITDAYNSTDFNWDTFISNYAEDINITDLIVEGTTYTDEEKLNLQKQALENKMFEFALKNYAISICGNGNVQRNMLYHLESNTFDEGIKINYYLEDNNDLKLNNILTSVNTGSYIFTVDVYIVEELTDSITGLNYFKVITKHEGVSSLELKVNVTNA